MHHFTVGQRRGLGVAAGRPLYVVTVDHAANRVIVGSDEELRTPACEMRDVNWIAVAEPAQPLHATVKIRNRHVPAAATVEPLDTGRACVKFEVPQRAVTPGQAAVFYSGDVVLGGGWIC